MLQKQFAAIIALIKQSRVMAIKAVNTELINLYWNVGAYISNRIANAGWGDKTVSDLAAVIQKNHPELKGFNRRGLYRMKQFYEIYNDTSIVSPVVTQLQLPENKSNKRVASNRIMMSDIRESILAKLSWTHHLTLISRTGTIEERAFYLKLCVQERYSKRELERQIDSGLFERVVIGNQQRSAVLKEMYPNSYNTFKDSYVFEFLNLPDVHGENDLQNALTRQMKNFILEMGKDYLFVGEEYRIQVGQRDFYIDLLFYHRGLQCLVAVELKKEKFEPEYLGKMNFYLEALDRDVKKENENPSIGILLWKEHDSEVVEYALSRSLSPTMVAEYRIQLPDKKLLREKLRELFQDAGEPTDI
jgi:predicted nuclease of restriction endonuclease-like (RecB) superfamily